MACNPNQSSKDLLEASSHLLRSGIFVAATRMDRPACFLPRGPNLDSLSRSLHQ